MALRPVRRYGATHAGRRSVHRTACATAAGIASVIDIDPADFGPGSFDSVRPSCGDCGKPDHVDMAQGQVIYPHRPDLWAHPDTGAARWWWHCSACGAYVGVHRGTLKPLGTPAGPDTRAARSAAHAVFDPMWQKRQRLSGLSKHHARGKGYKWLAGQLGIETKHCHIGMMDAATARRVVEICKTARAKENSNDG